MRSPDPGPGSSLILTGASGLIGRNFLSVARDHFYIYAVARRSQKESGVEPHANIRWIQVDVGNQQAFRKLVTQPVVKDGGARFFIHLAGYYDYQLSNNPEYHRTNVLGTRNVLEEAKDLNIERFVFLSSLAACQLTDTGIPVNESSPLNEDNIYARSKREGERLVDEYSQWYPCSVVRSAAVFTDWCEYGPLYMALKYWLSNKWYSRILGGRGQFSIPYIHINELNRFLMALLRHSNELPDLNILIASPDQSNSWNEIFSVATRFYFGRDITPVMVPKWLMYFAFLTRSIVGALRGKKPFERPWMARYMDRKLIVDGSSSKRTVDWQPIRRLGIMRRMLYMIEKMKSDPESWHNMNAEVLKHAYVRPNLLIYDALVEEREIIVKELKDTLLAPDRESDFPNYQRINRDNFNWDVGVFYQLLTASIRNNDRMVLLDYVLNMLVHLRFKEGFSSEEVCSAILETGRIILVHLGRRPELKGLEQNFHDYITLTIQMTLDEIENAFDDLSKKEVSPRSPARDEIEHRLIELAANSKTGSGKASDH